MAKVKRQNQTRSLLVYFRIHFQPRISFIPFPINRHLPPLKLVLTYTLLQSRKSRPLTLLVFHARPDPTNLQANQLALSAATWLGLVASNIYCLVSKLSHETVEGRMSRILTAKHDACLFNAEAFNSRDSFVVCIGHGYERLDCSGSRVGDDCQSGKCDFGLHVYFACCSSGFIPLFSPYFLLHRLNSVSHNTSQVAMISPTLRAFTIPCSNSSHGSSRSDPHDGQGRHSDLTQTTMTTYIPLSLAGNTASKPTKKTLSNTIQKNSNRSSVDNGCAAVAN
jgi:hypothetical protein